MLLVLGEKGKHASGTENRRLVWKEVVWPLILELNNVSFTLSEYQRKRNEVCTKFGIPVTVTSRGLVSLLQKNILFKEKDLYSIHYKLIPYMRLKVECNYATIIKEVRSK
ncbi:MAG: hypothetical protein HW420_416 [Candidatus Nitrosotenuis sp.]|jgi:hypothetical protein|nr:hypothetical protein [Candidatus Nitrosotenuis sp.]